MTADQKDRVCGAWVEWWDALLEVDAVFTVFLPLGCGRNGLRPIRAAEEAREEERDDEEVEDGVRTVISGTPENVRRVFRSASDA